MSRRARNGRRQGAALPEATSAHARVASDPERSLLESIAAGELDAHLAALARAIDARMGLLHTVRSLEALGEMCVGDQVRINQRARPRYLHGIHGTIVHLDHDSATVRIHRPVGRFESGEIRCPPLVLDKLAEARR